MITKRKEPTRGGAEILLAEDSLTQAEQIRHLLESHYYKVSVAQNGKQALDQLSKHKPSLVISDIMMPEMNGYELCKKIKFNKNTADIPVILLTRLTDTEEIIEGLSCGADSFITKPYNEKHLLSNIEKFLSEENREDHIKVPFGVQILFNGKKRFIQAEQQNVIKLVLDIYEGAIHQNERLVQTQEELRLLNERLESIVEDRTSDLSEEIKLSNQIVERLKISEEKYHSIFDNVTDLYYETSMDGTIIDVSPSINIFSKGQYNRDDLIGKSMSEFYTDPGKRQSLLTKLKEQGSITDFEIKLKNRDGSSIPCSISSKISFDVHGKPEKIIGSMRDISNRKRNEDIIRQERRLLRTLIDNIPDTIYVLDKDGRKVIANKADVENIGLSSENEVIGKTDLELFSGEIGKRGHSDNMSVIQSGIPDLDREENFFNRKGIQRWLLSSKFPLFDNQGNITGIVGIGHDITERKKNEEELIKAKEKAEESDRLKTAFLHNISHEIRTPMNAIVGFSALLGEPDLDAPTQQSYIEMIMQSSNNLLAIIKDILDISNIEANLVKADKSEFNLNDALKSLCDQFMFRVKEKKLTLLCEYGLEYSDSVIFTDHTKLFQILSNIIGNAIKFTKEGSIRVNYKVQDKFLKFSVADSGIGIPMEFQDRIFDRFFQVNNSMSRVSAGTGLGLSISKAYIELLGGRIWVFSKPETGTSIFFTIPYVKRVVEGMPVKDIPVTESFVFSRERKILVVEDVESNFFLIRYFLSKANATVLRAVNGKEAVEKTFSDKNIDLILMDIRMPEMDGLKATQLIREKNSVIPIIAQSAYVDEKEMAIECGCSGFITKPFDKKGLFNALREFL